MTSPAEPLPLSGLTVLQADDHLTTSFAAYTLRLLGARVVAAASRREQFEEDDALFRLFNPDSRLGPADGAEVAILGPGSSAAQLPRGLATAHASGGDLVEDGHWRDSELTLQAWSGWAAVTGDRGAGRTPLRAPGNGLLMLSGALLATLAVSLVRLQRHGAEAGHAVLDLRHAGVMIPSFVAHTSYGAAPSRHAPRTTHPAEPFDCANGPLFVSCVEDRRWVDLCGILGKPDWAVEFRSRDVRDAHWDGLQPQLQALLAPLDREAIFRACMEHHVPTVPIYTLAEVIRQPQLQQRAAEIVVDGQATPRLPWLAAPKGEPAAPDRGEPEAALTAPLSDLLVLDMSQVWAGAVTGQLLAALGAQVIKVESRANIDIFRRLGPFVTPGDTDGSANWNQLNQGKVSIVLEPGDEADLAELERYLEVADIHVANFRPGSSVALRMAAATARHPRLIEVAISGYGGQGPWAENALYGMGSSMVSGYAQATGREGGPLQGIGFAYGDPTSGIFGALAAVAAAFQRDRTGRAARIDLSMVEAVLFSTTDLFNAHGRGRTPARIGNRHPIYAPQGIYPAAGDDRWIALTVRSDAEWRALCAILALGEEAPGWDRDARRANHDRIDEAIAAWTACRSREESAAALRATGIAAAPVLEIEETVRDPSLRASGMIARVSHPAVGSRLMGGVPWTVDGVRTILRPAPLLDADRATAAALRARAAARRRGMGSGP